MSRDADYQNPGTERPQADTLRIENEALRRGFTLIPNYVLRARTISRDAKLLYGILLSYAWQKGNCWPGYDTLMEDLQCGRPQLAKYIKELKETGLVQVQRRGQGLTSIYTIKDVRPENFQKFRFETSGSFKLKSLGVSNRNGEENKGEEHSDQEHKAISKQKNMDVFHSNYPAAELSTTLRTQSVVDNSPIAEVGHRVLPPTAAPGKPSRVGQPPSKRYPYTPDPQPTRSIPVRGRPPKAPEYLAATMADISAKLHDENARSSLSRAAKLWKGSGLPEDKFVQRLHEASTITRQQGGVAKRSAQNKHLVNRMPYFFAVVEDLLGLKRAGTTEP